MGAKINMVWGLIGAAAIGGLFSAFGASKQSSDAQSRAREAAAFDAQQVQQQMDFQERMSGTSYQRGMTDMRAAGLNPMLAYQQGGADAPAGGAASMGMGQTQNILGAGVSSARQTYQAGIAAKLTKTQTDLTSEQVNSARSSAAIRKSEEAQAEFDANWIKSDEGQAFTRIKRASEAIGLGPAAAYYGFKNEAAITRFLQKLPTARGLDHKGGQSWKEQSRRLSRDNKLWRDDRKRLKR